MRLTRRAIISAIISMAYSFSSMLEGRRDHCMSSTILSLMKAAEACRGKYLLDSLMLFSDAAARREGINPDLHVCIILQCSVSDVMANNIVVHHILVLFCWKKKASCSDQNSHFFSV